MLYKVNEIQKDEGGVHFFFSSRRRWARNVRVHVKWEEGWGRRRGGAERGREPERGRVVDRGVSRPEFQRVTLARVTSWTDFPRPPCPRPEVFRAAKECSKRSRENPKKEKITG